MIKNIVFDLGNVLIHFNPDDYLGNTDLTQDVIEFIKKEIFLGQEWIDLDRGMLTREEAKTKIIQRNNENIELLSKYLDEVYTMLTPIEYNVEILKSLKEKGYKLHFLSNFHDEAFSYVKAQYDFFDYFDDGIISAHINMLKPEEGIYNAIIDKAGILAKESLFIDDSRENVEAAKKLGFHTIHLVESKSLMEKLKEKKIL